MLARRAYEPAAIYFAQSRPTGKNNASPHSRGSRGTHATSGAPTRAEDKSALRSHATAPAARLNRTAVLRDKGRGTFIRLAHRDPSNGRRARANVLLVLLPPFLSALCWNFAYAERPPRRVQLHNLGSNDARPPELRFGISVIARSGTQNTRSGARKSWPAYRASLATSPHPSHEILLNSADNSAPYQPAPPSRRARLRVFKRREENKAGKERKREHDKSPETDVPGSYMACELSLPR